MSKSLTEHIKWPMRAVKCAPGPLDTPCILWTGKRHSKLDYGMLRFEGRDTYVHRVSFYMKYGHWPKVCRHRCDTPACFNAEHLLDGTQADNVRDCIERGRDYRGKGRALVNEGDVRAIRRYAADGMKHRAIAAAFGLGYSTISSIVTRRTWAHVK